MKQGTKTMQRRYIRLAGAAILLMGSWWGITGVVSADDHLPSDCDTARDRAKSKYGAVSHYFDTFNRCVSNAKQDLTQCRAELDDQQSALGDFIFAQRVAQDVCGAARKSGDLVQ
jgi:hypothetical protein